jgi:DNA-binding NtrC family response regulator
MRNNNILLIDNNINYLHLLSIFLESKGFNVTVTQNGIKAFEILENNGFSIVITCFNMPCMNDMKLAINMREQYPDIQVIIITNDLSPDLVGMAANAGITCILSRSLNITKLLSIIRTSL